MTPGILPSALRASLRLFQIAPGDLVNVDVSTCARCGGHARSVAAVEDPHAIGSILAHFVKHGALPQAHYQPAPRSSPKAVAA